MSESEGYSSLAPSLLVSMPQLVDPNFNRTVVLLCRHAEDGAFGLVVNRPAVASGRMVLNLDPPVTADRDLPVWIGGPVEPQRVWVLVGQDVAPCDSGLRIADGLYLSTAPELVRRLLEPEPPSDLRLVIGYAGWAPGQLEAELQASAWLMSDVDRDFIFDTPADRMWEAAIRRLGADPATLQMSRGVH